jgi:hypothetical protein
LGASVKWFEQLKKELAVKAEVPKFLLDADTLKVSNTTGIAMQMAYQPIINKTMRKRKTYGAGLAKVGKLVLTAHEKILGDDVAVLADNPATMYNLGVEFSSPLPKDEQTEVDLASKRIAAGLWSQAEGIRQVSGVRDLTRLSLELAADARAKLANALETQRANNGQQPVLSSVFLSSPFLSEDLVAVAKTAEPDSTADDANGATS